MSEQDSSASVLLVEDEESVRDVIGRLLKKLGYQVTLAADAEEALGLFEEDGDFDLVVTDIVMPGLNGIEMSKVLKEHHPDLPFLFISGYTSEELGVSPSSPPEPFLPKPFTKDDLSREVERALGSRP